MRGPWWLAVVALLLRTAAAAWGGPPGTAPGGPLELVELGAGGEAESLDSLAARASSGASATEGMRLLARATSRTVERAMAKDIEREHEAVEAASVMQETGHGYLIKDKHVFVSGSLRPVVKKVAKPARQSSAVLLKDSNPTIVHHLRAFAEVFGSGQPARKPKRVALAAPSKQPAPRRLVSKARGGSTASKLRRFGPRTRSEMVKQLLAESLVMLDEMGEAPDLGAPKGEEKPSKETKKLIKIDVDKINADLDAEEKKVEKSSEQVANQTSVKFKDSPEAQKFKVNGTKMASELEEKMTPKTFTRTCVPNKLIQAKKGTAENGVFTMWTKKCLKLSDQDCGNEKHKCMLLRESAKPNPVIASATPDNKLVIPAMNISANLSDFVSLSAIGQTAGTPMTWGARRGAAKNFAANPKLRIKKLATIEQVQRMDSIRINGKDTGFIVHGNALSRIDVASQKVELIAGHNIRPGKADGKGGKALFHQPQDVAVFDDPDKKGNYMAVVADNKNDNLRLVQNVMGEGVVSTVLKEKFLVQPRRVAVIKADFHGINKPQIYTFVVCGRRTLIRVENILKRDRGMIPPTPYADEKEKNMTDASNKLILSGKMSTVHMLSETDFDHLDGLAAVTVQEGKGVRWLLYATDRAFKGIYRLEHILHGEQRAVVTKIARLEHAGDLVVLGSASSWFALVADNRDGQSRVTRVDQIMDGESLARTTPLPLDDAGVDGGSPRSVIGAGALKGMSFVGLSGGADWGGQLFGSTRGDSSDIVQMDLTVPLQCKDEKLLSSEEFQELGELQDLGDVRTKDGPMYLYDWVAMGSKNETDSAWTMVNYWMQDKSVCAVSTVTNARIINGTVSDEREPLIWAYYCDKKVCWPL